MRNSVKCLIGGASLCLFAAGLVHAQNVPPGPGPGGPGGPPPGAMAPAGKDPAAAPAGAYRIDLEHSSVVARVSHRGLSYNVVRFGVREGALSWNPANPAAIALDVTVDMVPYYAPIVYTIPPEGPVLLNVAAFPEARFVSSSVRVTGEGRAVVEGSLTWKGVTKPATINAELVGAGPSMTGGATVGFTGSMMVNWSDFNAAASGPGMGNVTVILDAEFMKS